MRATADVYRRALVDCRSSGLISRVFMKTCGSGAHLISANPNRRQAPLPCVMPAVPQPSAGHRRGQPISLAQLSPRYLVATAFWSPVMITGMPWKGGRA
jgi:hypothetical protein